MKKCIVSWCHNPRLKGRRTCGCHGASKRNSSARRVKSRLIHLDAAIPELPDERITFRHIDYEYPQIVFDPSLGLLRVTGLPTNEYELASFVAQWLSRPGHTLETLYALTPRELKVWPDDCSLSALSLLQFDAHPPHGYHMQLAGVAMVAIAVKDGAA